MFFPVFLFSASPPVKKLASAPFSHFTKVPGADIITVGNQIAG